MALHQSCKHHRERFADATVKNPDYAVTPEPDAAAQLNVNLTPTLS